MTMNMTRPVLQPKFGEVTLVKSGLEWQKRYTLIMTDKDARSLEAIKLDAKPGVDRFDFSFTLHSGTRSSDYPERFTSIQYNAQEDPGEGRYSRENLGALFKLLAQAKPTADKTMFDSIVAGLQSYMKFRCWEAEQKLACEEEKLRQVQEGYNVQKVVGEGLMHAQNHLNELEK